MDDKQLGRRVLKFEVQVHTDFWNLSRYSWAVILVAFSPVLIVLTAASTSDGEKDSCAPLEAIVGNARGCWRGEL
jgi:hypothetical protein